MPVLQVDVLAESHVVIAHEFADLAGASVWGYHTYMTSLSRAQSRKKMLSAARQAGRRAEQARQRMLAHARTRQEAILLLHEQGMSVRELARSLDCSPAVVQSAIRSAQRHRSVDVLPRREERVAYELHRALVGKILVDRTSVTDTAANNLERARANVRGTQAHAWLDEWARLLEAPTAELVAQALRTDEHGASMRQVSPFAGLLDQPERVAAIEKATSHAA